MIGNILNNSIQIPSVDAVVKETPEEALAYLLDNIFI